MSIELRNCRFAFKCTQEWAALTRTRDVDIRYCKACAREVHFCADDEDVAESIRLNRCVAIEVPDDQGLFKMLLGEVVGP